MNVIREIAVTLREEDFDVYFKFGKFDEKHIIMASEIGKFLVVNVETGVEIRTNIITPGPKGNTKLFTSLNSISIPSTGLHSPFPAAVIQNKSMVLNIYQYSSGSVNEKLRLKEIKNAVQGKLQVKSIEVYAIDANHFISWERKDTSGELWRFDIENGTKNVLLEVPQIDKLYQDSKFIPLTSKENKDENIRLVHELERVGFPLQKDLLNVIANYI
jgi:hypothetical protein